MTLPFVYQDMTKSGDTNPGSGESPGEILAIDLNGTMRYHMLIKSLDGDIYGSVDLSTGNCISYPTASELREFLSRVSYTVVGTYLVEDGGGFRIEKTHRD